MPTHEGGEAERELARFAVDLSIDRVPDAVISRTQALFLDWVGSALVGWTMHPVPLFDVFAREMGPADGRSDVLGGRRRTSPWFAAFVNGAASHVAELDDLHNGSVLHPATVVFSAVLAAAQDRGTSGADLLAAAIAGYEVGVRVGEFLGRSHYRLFHTTGTVGTIAAAAGVGRLIGLDEDRMINALGSAGTQAAGLWAFLKDAADFKQLHTAKAAADGLLAAYMAEKGLTGARRIFTGSQGFGAAMSDDPDSTRLLDGLGDRWATAETSFKWHACCRHIHPAADALLALIASEKLTHHDIAAIETHVHQGAIDVLGAVDVPETVHQAKFSMGSALGLLAVHGTAGLDEFEQFALTDPDVAQIRSVTSMTLDPAIDAAYPARWLGRVSVTTRDGRILRAEIDEPKGDPGNTLSPDELVAKFRSLAARAPDWSTDQAEQLIAWVKALPSTPRVESLL